MTGRNSEKRLRDSSLRSRMTQRKEKPVTNRDTRASTSLCHSERSLRSEESRERRVVRKRRPGFFAAAALNDTKKSPTAKRRHLFCHPDEASIASGWKDLGQRGASAAGSGSSLLHPIKIRTAARFQKLLTGFADEGRLRGNRPCVTS